MTATPDGGRAPTMLVIGHDTDPATTLVQAGTLVDWARERGVALLPATATTAPDPATVDAVVVLGALEGAWDDTVPWLADEIALLTAADRCDVPVLGLCFGGQLLARVLGGTVAAATNGEHGWTDLTTTDPALVASGPWLEFHSDSFTAPPDAERVASSPRCDQAFRLRRHVGVQFHPEITPAVFETWAARWAGTEFEARLPELGVSTAALRAEIAARADAARAAGRALFDGFTAQAGLGHRMLVRTRSEGRP